METVELILGILLGVLSLVLVAVVMMQSGKDKKLSGAIVGGADTFFAKGKSGQKDRMLRIVTTALSAVFFCLVLALYCVTSH